MIVTPPYPFTWDPPAATAGGPTVINRGASDSRGTRAFYLAAAQNQPSRASLLTSFGVDAGPASERSELWVLPEFDLLATFFYLNTTLASARTAMWLAVYVEEFDRSGAFVRAIEPEQKRTVIDEDHWWFNGSHDWSPGGRSLTIPSQGPAVRPHAGFSYRVWIDVHAEISAAGWNGRAGGSGAIAQATVLMRQIEVNYVPL